LHYRRLVFGSLVLFKYIKWTSAVDIIYVVQHRSQLKCDIGHIHCWIDIVHYANMSRPIGGCFTAWQCCGMTYLKISKFCGFSYVQATTILFIMWRRGSCFNLVVFFVAQFYICSGFKRDKWLTTTYFFSFSCWQISIIVESGMRARFFYIAYRSFINKSLFQLHSQPTSVSFYTSKIVVYYVFTKLLLKLNILFSNMFVSLIVSHNILH